MRNAARLLPLLLLLLPFHALAQRAATVFTEAQACTAGTCTRANPTLPTQGTPLGQLAGYRVTLCAEAGQTLSGGTLHAWLYDPAAGLWMRDYELDLPVAPITAQRCRAWPDVEQLVRATGHRVLYVSSAVAVSGGATVTVRIHPHVAPR